MMEWRSFPAMGTTIAVLGDARMETSARTLFDHYEATMSRFRPESELSRLNRHPDRSVAVGATLAAVLRCADDARARTEGLADPAIGSSLQAWGYDRTFFDVSDRHESPDNLRSGECAPSWEIDGRVVTRTPGTVFDLGGIAKGWAADRAVEQTGAWAVNAGGDLRSRHPELDVRIRDPWEGVVGKVQLGIGALATSSAARRTWNVAGERVHHLIDPRLGRPAVTPVLQASVLAETAALAEAGAKTMILHGERSLAWAGATAWVEQGVAVWADGSIYATRGLAVAA